MRSTLELARSYLNQGFSIIPIQPYGKKPLVAWKEYQTRLPRKEEVDHWFTGDNNIGIVTGAISNLIVIDCDSDEATEMAKQKGLPPSPVSKTAHGYHFFYRYTDGVRNFQKRDDLPGIDLRAEGGYVVAPPSTHPEGPIYTWVKNLSDLVNPPTWILADKTQKTNLALLSTAGATQGTRNDSLARLTGKWCKNLTYQEVLDLANGWNKKNNPPLPELEVLTTVNSIWANEQRSKNVVLVPKEFKKITEQEIISIDSLKQKTKSLFTNGVIKGEYPGWMNLEPFYTVRKGEWTLVTGIPGHGKTEFLDNLLVKLATNSNWKFGIFSAENLPHERHTVSLIEKYTGKPFLHGFNNRLTEEELNTATDFLNQHFFFLNPTEEDQSVDRILQIGKVLIAKHGIDGLLIDPWNELDHSRPASMNETEYISTALSHLRRFARLNQIHIWVVAHPAKMPRSKEDGTYPVPSPYDVHGSAHWRNKADNAICVWRDLVNKDSPTEIHVQKIRFREIGKIGMAQLVYNVSNGKFSDY